jgi:glycosyltransferase involved in cell wall biosynthesis
MKVALVHDWLTGMRGGEKVLEVLCERFPDADLFTLLHVRGSVSPTIERHPIHTSPLQWMPHARAYYRQCLLLFPTLVERIDLGAFDLVISSSHCVAKSVKPRPGAVHVCYCHTPMRYAWDQFDAYFGRRRVGAVRHALMRRTMGRMARWDRATSGRVSRYVTNSQHVAGRIRRYYNREAIVVYPPVDTHFFHPAPTVPERFALVVSALVPYKRLEIAIGACREAGVPLKIVGTGPDRSRLERVAGNETEFLGRRSDEELRELYRRAAMVLMPGEEDFGIAPVEAQACGRPVVALARGGALETVIHGETGMLVDEPTSSAFAHAIRRTLERSFDSAAIRRHAERFGRARFGDEMEAIVAAEIEAARAQESTLGRDERESRQEARAWPRGRRR